MPRDPENPSKEEFCMKKIAIAAAVMAAVVLPAQAQVKPEDHVKQRRSAMAIIGYNFSNLSAMAQDKKPYDKEDASRSADLVAALAAYPRLHFTDDTQKFADTKAKPEIYQKRADFDAKMDKMNAEVKTLPAAARADLASLKKAVGETGKTCKSCHDDYKDK
jgi:cytochrome c556